MKKLIITAVLFLISGLLYWSCKESNLDLLPLSETEASVFDEEQDYNRAVIGVYAKLSDIYWFNGGGSIHGMWQLPGDDITTVGTSPFETFAGLNASNGSLNYYYKKAYELIDRANTTIQKIDEDGGKLIKTPGLADRMKAEATFLRGYMHFCLFNYFGTSPVRIKRVDTPDEALLRPANSSGMQLLDQAIADFEAAAGKLPATYPATDAGRVTSNTANAFLGKALVFRGSYNKATADFTSALTALNKVQGTLIAKFADNFAYTDENNGESLFEFQAAQPGFDNVWLSNDFESSGVGSTSAYWGWYENHWSLFGAPRFVATKKLLQAFETGDPRLEATMDPATRDIRKYVTTDQKTQAGVGSVNNPRILRFADVILLKAEATLESGGTNAAAIAFVNLVRTRARDAGAVPANLNTAESDKAKVLGWIANERFVELAGEECHRWWDLKRWNAAGKISLQGFDFSTDSPAGIQIQLPTNLLWPLPGNELDLNPNMRQNPGY